MPERSREFQVFVKPAGAECNLRCTYCYYTGSKALYPGVKRTMMKDAVLEKYIQTHIEASTEDIISFSWHGGEPLIAGIGFFRKVVGYQRKFQPGGKTIINGIQTNGTLLNEEWCSFFAEEKFNVGISIDGPEEFHNLHRIKQDQGHTFRDVMRGYRLLVKWKIQVEILCVVNAVNVKQPLALYSFFREAGARYLTFLPLVIHHPGSDKHVSADSVPSAEFGEFLCAVFDEWLARDIGSIKVQIFEEALRTAFDQEHTLCIFKKECGGVPVVEHNGDFYSCDHYADADHLAGNIMKDSLASLLDSSVQKEFGRAKSLTLPKVCRECEVLPMCNGECPKNRFMVTSDGEPGLNYLCNGYKLFFSHILPFIEAVRTEWKAQELPASPPRSPSPG